MSLRPAQLVEQIHAAAGQVVLALNGGSRAVAELLEIPGGSRTVLEAVVPYSEGSLTAWLGSRPESACSSRTARAMAVVAFGRALRFGAAESLAAGVACTAGLATNRPKQGAHRAHVALQTAATTRHWSLELEKGARRREEEEQVVGRMVLNSVAEACGLADRLELPLRSGERVEAQQITAPPLWQELFLGRAEAVLAAADRPGGATAQAIFAGAFYPLHVGHLRMVEIARDMLGLLPAMELSVENVDKPVLDYLEIDRRLAQFGPQQPAWLTRAATFDDKSRLFPGATFVVGIDTLRRVVDPRYYGNDFATMLQVVRRIVARECSFLVFCRISGDALLRLADLELPDELRQVCMEVPPDIFREDISSTELRRQENW